MVYLYSGVVLGNKKGAQLGLTQQHVGLSSALWEMEEAKPRRLDTVSYHLFGTVSKPKPYRQKTDQCLAGGREWENCGQQDTGMSGVNGIFECQWMQIYLKML